MEIKQFPKITVILRGYTYEQVRCVVKNLVGTRLNAVEITTNSPDVFTTIRKISEEFGKDVYVGAGTVLNMEHAKAAVEAGSTFLLSPIMLDQEILDFCKEKGVISVPAAFSPSEVWKMAQGGADIVKIFPAGRVGSQYFADVQAPLGKLPLMAVGGVNGENVQEYLDKGASFAGIASGIFKKEDILNQNEEGIRESIRQFEERVQWRGEYMEGIKFDSRQVLMLTGMENDEQVLSAVADAMCEMGLVKDTYKQAILDREKEFPTGLNTGGCNIAIPHADVTHVNEASICVGILEEPVMFHAMDEPDDLIPVKMVIMLALKEAHSHLDMLQKVVELIQDQALVKQIVETKEKDTVCQLLKEKLL